MTTTKNALVVRGGWDGHQPVEATDLFIPFLREQGFTVRVEESTAVYADAAYLAGVDLIVQCNTMNTIERAEFEGLRAAIAAGTGHGRLARRDRRFVPEQLRLPAPDRGPVRLPSVQGPRRAARGRHGQLP